MSTGADGNDTIGIAEQVLVLTFREYLDLLPRPLAFNLEVDQSNIPVTTANLERHLLHSHEDSSRIEQAEGECPHAWKRIPSLSTEIGRCSRCVGCDESLV